MKETKEKSIQMPVLALRGIVLFPGILFHFDIGRKKSLNALKTAMAADQMIFLVAQKDIRDNDPKFPELYDVGVVSHIRQVIKIGEESVRVLVEGKYRAKVKTPISDEEYLYAEIMPCEEKKVRNTVSVKALVRKTQELFGEYTSLLPKMSPDVMMGVLVHEDAGSLADFIASNIVLKTEDKQEILSELNPVTRLKKLMVLLEQEIEILNIEKEMHTQVREQIEQNQREYYLREQLKYISNELGEGDNPLEEAEEYRQKIYELRLPREVEEKFLKECNRLAKMPPSSHEATVIRGYLDTCLDLPWNKVTQDTGDIERARKQLDRDHYGLERVKERILELLAVRSLAPNIRGQIICLVGPAGVGKTSIAKSVAKAMGRRFARISLGGVRDEAEIRGHRKTYIGAMPGRIISAIKQAGSRNPLILLDEIDKLSNDFRGDPAAALLEVLDSEQNHAFRDHYIEVPFDLSNVFFITTANDKYSIPGPLLDRMEVIEMTSYTREEKFNIAKKHLIPKQRKRHGLDGNNFRLTDEALYILIDNYTREGGVRSLERTIATLCRKAAKKIVEGECNRVSITADDLEKLLGPKKYRHEFIAAKDEVGVVTGLAWTSTGGETMAIEVAILDGSGKIELTGNLGSVMKESAHAAITYIRSKVHELNISPDFYKEKDIHIHVPEGAIPKDGPSAGIAMATALVSALTGCPVRRDVAMTGEITLRGRVMPIGGLKEKTMAAYRAGITKVIVPAENKADLAEIDEIVKKKITFITAENMDTVLKHALIKVIDKTGADTLKAGGVPEMVNKANILQQNIKQ